MANRLSPDRCVDTEPGQASLPLDSAGLCAGIPRAVNVMVALWMPASIVVGCMLLHVDLAYPYWPHGDFMPLDRSNHASLDT